jgi:magnesium-transporting ATPase (P-type)
MDTWKKIKDKILLIATAFFTILIQIGFVFLIVGIFQPFLHAKLIENKKIGLVLTSIFLIILLWIYFKLLRVYLRLLNLRVSKSVDEEEKLITKIIKENPRLNEEELIKKIESELLMKNPHLSRIISAGKEILLRERIKKRVQEIKKMEEEISKLK